MGINAESENTLAESLPNIIFSCLPQTLKRLFSVLLYPLSLINPYGELFDGALDRCIGIKGSRLLGSLLQKSADDHEYIPGLWNVGNSCFANVIIQSLASLDIFQRWISAQFEVCMDLGDFAATQDSTLSQAVKESESIFELSKLLKELNTTNSSRSVISPFNFLSTLKSVDNRGNTCYINYGQQQDAHEMLQILLDHLSDEAEKIHTRKRKVFDGLKFFESLQLRGPEVSDSAARLQQLESLSAKGRMPFAGLMEHVIICEICGFMSSVRLQVFNNISVPVLDVGICSVEDMLENYFSQEQISGWVCDNCTTINALKAIGAGAAKCMEGLMPILKSLTEQGVISPSAALSFSKDLDIGKLLSSMPHGKIDKKVLEYARTLRKLDAEKKKYELYATNKFSEEFRPASVGKSVRRVSSMAVKRQLVASQPACLCLHVQRATLTASGRTAKNSSGVTFGRKLSFRPWISNRSSPREASSRGDESSECVYVLKAVVLHFGGDSSGHFVAYRCLSPYPESRPIVGSSADSGTLTQNWHLHINTIGLASSQPDTPSDTPDCPCATEASRAQLRPAAETCHSDPQESESADSGSGRAHNTCDSPRWYRLSDERVTSVGGDWMKELEKYSSNVYILFYERVGDGA